MTSGRRRASILAMDAKLSLGELSALYLVRCEVEGKSAQTVRAYGETLGRFRRAVAVDDAAAVTPRDVYLYLGGFSHPGSTGGRLVRTALRLESLVRTQEAVERPHVGDTERDRDVVVPEARVAQVGSGGTPQRAPRPARQPQRSFSGQLDCPSVRSGHRVR